MRSFPEAELATETAASVNDVKGAPRRGKRIGNWLTREQAQELLLLVRPRKPQGKMRLRHPGAPARLWTAPDGTRPRGKGGSDRPAGEPLGACRHPPKLSGIEAQQSGDCRKDIPPA